MFIPALDGKQYYLDAANGVVWFSQADGSAGTGTTPVQVTHAYTFYSQYLTATELYLLQSGGLAITVAHGGKQKLPDGSLSVIFSAGQPGYMPTVVYYPSGAALAGTNTTSAPTVAGTYTWYRNDAGSGIFQFASGDIGQQVVITYPYLNPDYDTTAVSAQQNHGPFAIDFLQGTSGQAPPTGLSSKHPDQFANGALGYTDTAVAYQESGYLGTSGTLPSYSYEVIGSNVVGGGTIDADPVLAMQSLLTDNRIGINFPAGSIDTKSWFTNSNSASAWVNANKFYVSQAITNPTALSSIVGRWLEAFNIAAVWSEGLIKLVPYGDQSVSSTSPVPATYTPDLTVVAQLTDDDFLLTGENKDPVKVTRSSWADAYNRVQVGYRNRVNAYNTDLVFEEDQGSIERFGLRIEGQQSLEFIATWQLAAAVANMRLKRYQSVRNTYAFALPSIYEYLEPMDLVSLTDTRLGLDAQVVRITKITNDPVKGLAVEAEDFPGNAYAMPTTNAKAATPALHPTIGTAPAGQTEIVIVQASNAQASSQMPGKIYVWMRGKDSSTWGGADLYRSLDGSNWELMSINVPVAPIYTLTAALPSVASAPSGPLSLTHDSGSTLSVQPATSGNIVPLTAGLAAWSPDASYSTGNMVSYDARAWIARASSQGIVPTDSDPHWYALSAVTASAGSPPSVSDAAAANLQNLVAVVGTSTLEFLSYANVAAGTLTNTYNLTDLYRGALGTTPQAAPTGSVMVAFDSASATWDIPAGLSGQTIYFRYIARNARGVAMQTLEDAETITFVVQAPGSGAAWDSLGGPIGDVIGDNGGRGQLNVNPAGGVKNELPHVNHSSQVQAVINGSSAIVSGTPLSASGTLMSTLDLGAVTGTQRNQIPDSGLKLGAGYWMLSSGTVIGYSPAIGGNAATFTATGSNGPSGSRFIQGRNTGAGGGNNAGQFANVVGNTYTLSCYLDPSNAGGDISVNVQNTNGAGYKGWAITKGSAAKRYSFTWTAVAGDPTEVVFLVYDLSNSVWASATRVVIGAPQVEVGSVMTAYRESVLDDQTGGLNSGVLVQGMRGALGLQIGDVHDRVNSGFDGSGRLLTGTVTTPAATIDDGVSRSRTGLDTGGHIIVGTAATPAASLDSGASRANTAIDSNFFITQARVGWRAFLGDTSGDITASIVDGASKRFLHGAMSGATQSVINPSSQLISGTPLSASGTLLSTIDYASVTGTQQNLVPDSDLKYPSQYWPTGNGISIGYGGGFGSGLTLVLDCNADVTKQCPNYFPVTPGENITLSANMAANSMTAGYALVGLDWAGRSAVWELDLSAGSPETRMQRTFTVPAGVYQMRVYYGQWALTGSPAGTAYINQIQVEVGSAMTAYKSNALDMLTGGLPVNLQVQEPGGALSPAVLGDIHKRGRLGFDVNGYLLTGTVATPVANLDTGASRANTAIDSGNVLVSGSADFSRYYRNQHLGYMPDDPVSGRLARRSAYIGVGGTATWINLGTWTFPADGGGYSLRVEGNGGQGFNSGSNQQAKIEILVRSGDGGVDNRAPNISGCTWFGHGNSAFVSGVKVISHGGSTAPTQNQWDVLISVNSWSSAHWDFYCDARSNFATSGATTTDPGAGSTTVVVGAGQYVHDTSANLYGALLINGTTKTSIGLHDLHDRVAATINGYGGAGLANVPDDAASSRYAVLAIDGNRRPLIDGASAHTNWTQDHLPNGADYGRAAITQLDASGNIVVVGTSGTGPRLNVGNGTMTPSTGGKQMKRFYVTAPTTAGYSDGQVFYFTSASGSPYLLDQGGAAMSGFDNPPYVALFPYGMTTPPTSFYAGGVTKTQFTMHAINGGTFTSASTNLTNGTNSVYSVGTGDTAITVNIAAQATTSVDVAGPLNTPVYQNQIMTFTYSVTANGGTVTGGTGTIGVTWNSDGNSYTGSGSISCSVPAGDTITIKVTWTNATDATGSASYTVTYTQSTGATGVNFIAMIGENW